jgi:hypothetical protein
LRRIPIDIWERLQKSLIFTRRLQHKTVKKLDITRKKRLLIEKDWANMERDLRDTAPLCDLL